MAEKQPKKQTEKVYCSITEFKEHFFPNSHKKELAHKKSPRSQGFWNWFGTGAFGGN